MSGSILPTISRENLAGSIYALSGSGGGGGSNFQTASVSSLTTSTIASAVKVRDLTTAGNHFIILQDEPLNGSPTGGARGVVAYNFGGSNTGFISLQSSIKGANGNDDSSGGVRLFGGDDTQDLTIGGTSGNGVLSVGFLEKVDFNNSSSTIVSHLNAASIESAALTVGGAGVPTTSARGTNASASMTVGTPDNIGLNFNTVATHLYNVSLNATFTSNAFIGTTSSEPLIAIGIAGESAYSQPLTKSYISTDVAETGSPTIPLNLNFTFKAANTANTDVFAFLFDANVAASGGFDIVNGQGYLTDYGVQ
jgi:hypothetical protein